MIYHVAFVAWSCALGWLGSRIVNIPEKAKPLVCDPSYRQEAYKELNDAKDAVRKAGPGSTLWACEDADCNEIEVKWTTVAEFGE